MKPLPEGELALVHDNGGGCPSRHQKGVAQVGTRRSKVVVFAEPSTLAAVEGVTKDRFGFASLVYLQECGGVVIYGDESANVGLAEGRGEGRNGTSINPNRRLKPRLIKQLFGFYGLLNGNAWLVLRTGSRA